MKKIICLALIFSLCVPFVIVSSADSITDDLHMYETSGGITYNLEDYDIYWEDFEGCEFSSSQQVVDHIYNVGSARENSRMSILNFNFVKITVPELLLLIAHCTDIVLIVACREFAISKLNTYYPDQTDRDDGHIGNSFLHAYWTILLCYYLDPTVAWQFVVAHEEHDENTELMKTMDLYNDEIAHNYWTDNHGWINLQWYTNDQLAEMAYGLVTNGSLIYVVFNYSYIYATYYYEVNGRTTKITRTGDFYAYTNSTVPFNVPEPLRYVIPADPDEPILRPD